MVRDRGVTADVAAGSNKGSHHPNCSQSKIIVCERIGEGLQIRMAFCISAPAYLSRGQLSRYVTTRMVLRGKKL